MISSIPENNMFDSLQEPRPRSSTFSGLGNRRKRLVDCIQEETEDNGSICSEESIIGVSDKKTSSWGDIRIHPPPSNRSIDDLSYVRSIQVQCELGVQRYLIPMSCFTSDPDGSGSFHSSSSGDSLEGVSISKNSMGSASKRKPFLVLQLEDDDSNSTALLEDFYSFPDRDETGAGEREDVLASPAISPVPWAKDVPSAVGERRTAVNPSTDSTIPLQVTTGKTSVTLQVPSVRLPMRRRGSANSLTSDNEDEGESEPTTENLKRRGRRAAIYNSKNFIGENTTPDRSPNESGGEDNGSNEEKRRRSSLELNVEVLPRVDILKERSKKILRKQNTIADLTQKTLQSFTNHTDESSKKRGMSFLKLIESKRRTKAGDSLADLHEALGRLKPSEFRDSYLTSFRKTHWTDLLDGAAPQPVEVKAPLRWQRPLIRRTSTVTSAACPVSALSETERCRREAVWELFKSELTFLLDYLMVLKHCFLEPLKRLQVDGHLMFVEPQDLFGNIDELCYVSYTFSRDLISILSKESKKNQFGTTTGLLRAFRRWRQTTKDGEVFHNYCLNYHCALTYLDILLKHDHFSEFEKYCEQDSRCHRLQIRDLLVAPMQHCTKTPLLLANIRKYTAEDSERMLLTENLEKVESSLKSLEDKLKWLKNFERLQNIQQQLIWPSITEMDPRVFIPDFLKTSLSAQPCERLIANPKRQLVHEGYLNLVEANRNIEIYAFLFDDILLITKVKKPPKKKSASDSSVYSTAPTDGALFVVYRQPVALDRFSIHDIGFVEANVNGLKHAFVLVQISRFQQIIGVYTLQAPTDQAKVSWLDFLREAQGRFQEKVKFKLAQAQESDSPRTNKHSKLINKMQKLKIKQQKSKKLSDGETSGTDEETKRNRNEIGTPNRKSRAEATGITDSPMTTKKLERIQSEDEDMNYIVTIQAPFSPPLSPTIHCMGFSNQALFEGKHTLPNKFLDIRQRMPSGNRKGGTLNLQIDLRPRSSSDVREVDLSPDDDMMHHERSASVDVINPSPLNHQLSVDSEDPVPAPVKPGLTRQDTDSIYV